MNDERLRHLQQDELELERLREMVSPEYWPRIYAMLQRIREELKQVENSIGDQTSNPDQNQSKKDHAA